MVIALVNWVQIARVIYTETRVAGRARVHRGRARASAPAPRASCSATSCRIWCRPCIVWGTLGISTTVLLEATLSFLGIGVQPPTAVLGQHHLREPDLFPGRALAGVHSRAPRSCCWRWPSTSSATRCATSSTRPSGGATDGRLSRPPAGPGVLILLGVIARSPSCCSISCRPIRCGRSPGAAPRRRRSRTSATSSASTSRFSMQYWRYLGQPAAGRSRPLLHPADRGRRR